MGKAILKAGLIGGCYGLLCEALYCIYRAILGPENTYLSAFSLVTGGLIVGILYVCGIMQKIEPHGGFGSIIPLIGLTSAVAGGINATRKNEKKTFIDSFWSAGKPSMIMLMSGLVVSMILAMVFTQLMPNADAGVPPLLIATPAPVAIWLEFIFSFLIMAVIGAVGQIFLMLLKPTFTGVMGMLFAAYVLGCILAMFGVIQALAVLGHGGMDVPILGGGEFVFTSIWLGEGGFAPWFVTFVRLTIFSGIIASQYLWGGLAAAIRGKLHPEEVLPDEVAAEPVAA
ncbi:MAG: hypothetical protein LBN10_11010 [Propionibacteriaceae bacterium]|jgi:hypothetical protein|nr:hypothetical protein [Propionibacteriaceae bacterium]